MSFNKVQPLVMNQTKLTQYPEVVSEATPGNPSRKTQVRIMPRGRVTLPPGYSVDANWMALNPGVLKVHTPNPALIPKEPAPPVVEEPPVVETTNYGKNKGAK